jgi:outer membrane protein
MHLCLSSKKLQAIGILWLACFACYAEDLAEIMNLALQTDTTLAQARETELATLEVLPQARAGLLPTVSGTALTNYNATDNATLLNYNTFNVGLSISQQLFNIANWQTYRQADYKIKAAIANYEDSFQDLVLRVVTQYFKILKALDDLSFTIAERKAFARSLEETQQKFDAGVIAITDVNEAQAKFDSAKAQEIAAEYEVYNQKEIMGEITGVPAKNISLLRSNIILHAPIPDDIEFWVRNAVKQNYALQSKRFDAESAKKDIQIQRAANYPTVQADGAITRGKTAPPLPAKGHANSITFTMNLPIFSGGSIISKTSQAMHQYEIAVQQALNVERQVISNIRQAYRGVLTQISQIKALQQSVISSKSALDATTAAFEVGTRTIVDVLNSQTDLLRAMSNLSKARYDYIVASITLKRFSGVLQLEDVNIINGWLVPAPKQGPATDQDKQTT